MGGHHHHHGHSCDHHHLSVDNKLSWAAGINVILTIAQIIAGIFSGSLALIADALHNLSDAAAMILALVARKISRRHADDKRTYGYKKVETLAAFVNFITLIFIGLWLAYEAVTRFFMPHVIDGWIVVWVAGLAIFINGATAWLTYKDSKNSQNIRAAFIHNLTDMFSSVGVVVAGICILMFGWAWIDPVMTLIISAYVLWYAMKDLPKICNILIDGVPDEISLIDVMNSIKSIDGISDIHHLHVRYLNEHSYAMEAHIVMNGAISSASIKQLIKEKMHHFHIEHSTLEFEDENCNETHCDIKAF